MATGKTYNSTDSKEELILVQTGKGKFGGYKQDLLVNTLNETEVEFYVCTQCKGVMRNACLLGEEQIPICETCVENKVGSQPMMKARKKIPELKAKCPLATRGCQWNVTLSEVEIHLDVCQEFLVKCEYDCGVIVKRCDLNNHCSNECLNREVSCEHCQNKIVYRNLNRHYAVCLEFPLLCPNNCGTNLRRKQTDSHIETDCPNTIVKCRYERFGCKEVVKRCEMEEHRKINEIKHLEMTTFHAVSEIERLEEVNDQMKRMIESLSYPVVLRDTIKEKYSKRKGFFFRPSVRFEISWRFINLILIFGYPFSEVIPVSITMGFNKVMSPQLKWPFEGRFKLTIIDRINTDDSLIYESPVVKLQPIQQPEQGFTLNEENPDRFEITTIPKKLLLEDRFSTEKGFVELTLQIQEAEQVRMTDQMTVLNKKKELP